MTQALNDLRLPPERFYWAVLDTSSLPRSVTPGGRTRQLGYLLEPTLPVPLESVHAAFTPIDTTRVVACAMDHDELAGITDAASLGPASAPPFIDFDPSRTNLLTGRHEPHALRARRNTLTILTAAAMVLCTAVILIGAHRRVARAGVRTREIQLAQLALYNTVLPQSPSSQPPELRLIAELRQLQRTRTTKVETSSDISPALAALLAAWPAGLDIRAHSIILSQASATVTATVPDHDGAQRLADALDRSPIWRATNPQVQPTRDAVQVTLRLERAEDNTEDSER